MINEKGQVKVMDFGLAKLKGSLKLTKTSSTVGTLAYMAPEQIKGETTDARMDIFSFGVVFYEMLTGKLPFRGEYGKPAQPHELGSRPLQLGGPVQRDTRHVEQADLRERRLQSQEGLKALSATSPLAHHV